MHIFDANAESLMMFSCWSGVKQWLYLFLVRKACSLEGLTVMRGGHLTGDPLRTQAVIAEILVEDLRAS